MRRERSQHSQILDFLQPVWRQLIVHGSKPALAVHCVRRIPWPGPQSCDNAAADSADCLCPQHRARDECHRASCFSTPQNGSTARRLGLLVTVQLRLPSEWGNVCALQKNTRKLAYHLEDGAGCPTKARFLPLQSRQAWRLAGRACAALMHVPLICRVCFLIALCSASASCCASHVCSRWRAPRCMSTYLCAEDLAMLMAMGT
jgi:hypothetical protein